MRFSLHTDRTQRLMDWAQQTIQAADTPFKAAQTLVTRLGIHKDPDSGLAEVGFWVPELHEQGVAPDAVVLECFTPLEPIDLEANAQQIRFSRERVPLRLIGDYAWGVIDGMQAGTREQLGTLYWLAYQDADGAWHQAMDVLAYSVPYGCFAPSEYYDIAAMQAARPDAAHFRQRLDAQADKQGIPVVRAPLNILQIHTATATAEGSFAGLARLYRRIADKLRAGQPLTPAEQHFTGYDAVQLMPVEPTIEYEGGPRFWEMAADTAPDAEDLTVSLRAPDMSNWGYDVLIAGSAAPNPVLLGSKRPDELIDLIAALHDFPGKPIKVLFDVVYGHTDNQALPLMNHHYFAGANMYGQNLNYLNPVVRATLLEMQRRKHNYGLDGVRVDGAQDFKNWDPESDSLWHDDEYLQQMSDVVQEVAGVRYRPWMIFEDGRPWPRDDWELTSTYREVTKQQPDIFQWGPLTFAHNTPFLFTFWIMKWWRIREVLDYGGRWITGVANHDTLRRGTQVDPESRINTYLGRTLPEILRNAYDNPAANLFAYGIMPGLPMDFINASMRAPWSFIRNTDRRWAVKVVSEEKFLLDWVMDEARFSHPDSLPRLKGMGFATLEGLKRFMKALDAAVRMTDYDLDNMAQVMQAVTPPLEGPALSAESLFEMAHAWMDDMHALCNVSRYMADADPDQAAFNLAVRKFRRARPWLMDNLRPQDRFSYRYPSEGTIIFYGLRSAPDDREQVFFVANMEGAPRELNLSQLLETMGADPAAQVWKLALSAPGLQVRGTSTPLTLRNGQGAVFTRAIS